MPDPNDQNAQPDQGEGQPEQPEPAAQPPAQAHGNLGIIIVVLCVIAAGAVIAALAVDNARHAWQTTAAARMTKSQSDRIVKELHAFLHPPEPAANVRMNPPVEGVAFWESQRDGCAAQIRHAKRVGWHNQPYYVEPDAAKAVGMCLTDLGLPDKPPATTDPQSQTTTGKATSGPSASNVPAASPPAVQGPPAAEQTPTAPSPTEPSGPTDAGTTAATEQVDAEAAVAAASAPAALPSAPPVPIETPPVVAVELTADECRGVIEQHVGEITTCYRENVWSDLPNAGALAQIRFYVNTDGYVRMNGVTANWVTRPRNELGEINPDRFLGCVRDLAHEWRFPYPRRRQSICERTVAFDEVPPTQ